MKFRFFERHPKALACLVTKAAELEQQQQVLKR